MMSIDLKHSPRLFMKGPNDENSFLLQMSRLPIEKVYEELQSSPQGLSLEEAKIRTEEYGKNEVAREKPQAWTIMLISNFKNPFIFVLIILGSVSFLTDDIPGTLIVTIMIALSVMMRFSQEYRSSRASETLRKMVRTKATTKRKLPVDIDDIETIVIKKCEIPFEDLVPGDIIYLSAGDMIPADVRIVRSKDLFISQSALTGESIPVEKYDVLAGVVEKHATEPMADSGNPMECGNLGFMGTSVVSGSGKAIVLTIGRRTFFGSLAKHITGHRSLTSFDKGVNSVTWLLIKFILIMVPIVFIINIITKGNWQGSFLFAIAVAVGLTPEMLPMVVTANLAKGALAMSKHKVIVKRLNSIQNLGAMDILCTDKTGTLTQDRIILQKYLDVNGEDSNNVLELGFLNSYYQTGLKNMLDKAVLDYAEAEHMTGHFHEYQKIDEIPFDFIRRRMAVVLSKDSINDLLICKGAVDELLSVCSKISLNGEVIDLDDEMKSKANTLANDLNEDGFRVIAVAYKKLS